MSNLPLIDEPSTARFWQKVNKAAQDACWNWTAYRTPLGYGQMRLGPRIGGRAVLASRVAFCIAHRCGLDAITGLSVCHHCDNPSCVNPSHLFLGTQADNVSDMVSKGRYKRERNFSRGSRHGMAKLTEDTVRAIRSETGDQREAARRFGVSQGTIHLVRARKIWRHVA